jgi:hypothetical protein
MVGVAMMLGAQSVANPAEARDWHAGTDELVVRYDVSAPASRWNGRPWGSQCVERVFARELTAGQWLGAGMRIVRFDRVVPAKTAQKVASQLERCPYVLWAEPNEKQLFVI